jgi:hypothetical protein
LIDPAVGLPTEQQVRLGLAGAIDAGPTIVRVGAPQVGQIGVDGVGMDIDDGWEWLGVDGGSART